MIARSHAKKEIIRLSSTHFYPSKQPAALSELIDALQLGSKSPEHATLVITEALDSSASCPTPADLKRLCAEVARSSTVIPAGCDKCQGNWRQVRVLWKGAETGASVRCTCARGRLLTDRENEERRKEERPPLRLPPGITFIYECDRDLAEMHGFALLGDVG